MKAGRLKIILSTVWLALTFSMVSWWFFFTLHAEPTQDPEQLLRHHRMIVWEGGFLLAAVLVGGAILIFYVYKDSERHERLRDFFANFSHDMKTAISRLRLQAEILAEGPDFKGHKTLGRLLKDLTRLDLQLENSLLLTHMDESLFLLENLRIQNLIQSLQIEFEEINIKQIGDGEILGDSRALRSIFRNLVENSVRHGQATELSFTFKASGGSDKTGKVDLILTDNGRGSLRDIQSLGQEIFNTTEKAGSGIGLFLARKLIHKMRGQIHFSNLADGGFQIQMTLPGKVI